MKRGKGMILISKEIAHKLNKDYRIRFGENGISTSKTKHKKYYLCENEYNIKSLYRISSDDKFEQLLKKIKEDRKRFAEENNKYF